MTVSTACDRLIASSGDSPVVLLETHRPDVWPGCSYLFLNPLTVVRADTLNDVDQALSSVRDHIDAGRYAAGYVTYEAGYAFEPTLDQLCPEVNGPLLWFGIYDKPTLISPYNETGIDGGFGEAYDPERAMAGTTFGLMDAGTYHANISRIKEYIASGDSYQINFTGAFEFEAPPSPYDCYRYLTTCQHVSYAAFIRHDGRSILSLSPELFFRIDGDTIISRPMKGTIRRGRTTQEDILLAKHLRTNEKDRAENVMIVDLIRNDIGKLCIPGSVQVPDLFAVERYDTLMQMTSTVKGRMVPGTGIDDVFRALYPCGSVTGAPKIRSMEIIRELESKPRGVYTGAIGFAAPDGNAVFNVSIRTAVVEKGQGTMGIGSGVVWDSDPAAEYAECELKRQFFTTSIRTFALIETMRVVKGRIRLINYHLDRLIDSAAYFGYPANREIIARHIAKYIGDLDHTAIWKVRLLLDRNGDIDITSEKFEQQSGYSPVRIAIAPVPTNSGDRFLYHKTTNRQIYQSLHTIGKRYGLHDLIFVNEHGEITEGCISNVFISIDGQIVTSPVSCGLLDGVMRRHILARTGAIIERPISPDDLRHADRIILSNAVRGILEATVIDVEIDPHDLTHESELKKRE